MKEVERYVVKQGKRLRCGFTTGTCAAAAAAAAAELLFSKKEIPAVRITLPGGEEACLPIFDAQNGEGYACCTVEKDAGDDPDVTDGIHISAEIRLVQGNEIALHAGAGVGIVTAQGLPCGVGEPAINPVPRQMILDQVKNAAVNYGYNGGLRVTISAENGAEIAKKTFNPRLGIVGGISILGTTGIVEPMSNQALIDTIKAQVDQAKANQIDPVLITPGNYGQDYCKNVFRMDLDNGIKCSNDIGETLDYLVYQGFQRVLLAGHIGKLVKLAGGIMNTHSSVADGRMEILAAHAAMAGADRTTVCCIMACRTTEEAIDTLEKIGLLHDVLTSIMDRIQFHLNHRVHNQMQIEVLLFSSGDRLLGASGQAKNLAEQICRRENKQEDSV